MSSDGELLIRAMIENHADDTPRLMYADWLEENGHPDRAEHVRLGVAVERTIAAGGQPTPEQARRRAEMLPVRRAWLAALPRFPGLKWLDSFDRGVPCGVQANTATAFLKSAPELFRIAPIGVSVRGVTDKSLADLTASEHLARVWWLDFENCPIGDEGVAALCGSPHLASLCRLHLPNTAQTDAGMRTLSRCSGMPKLDWLTLDRNEVTDAGVRALVRSPHFPRLTQVYTLLTSVTARGEEALRQWLAKNERARRKDT